MRKSSFVVALMLAAPAVAGEAPLLYQRTNITVQLASGGAATLDTEIRDAASAQRTPGWYNFATLGQARAAMMAYPAPISAALRATPDYAPVDVLFLDAYGTILQIAPSLVPAELKEPITAPQPVLALLYLGGGACEKLGIQPGDKVHYALFKQKPVVLTAPGAAAPAEPASAPAQPLMILEDTQRPPHPKPPEKHAEKPTAKKSASAPVKPVEPLPLPPIPEPEPVPETAPVTEPEPQGWWGKLKEKFQ